MKKKTFEPIKCDLYVKLLKFQFEVNAPVDALTAATTMHWFAQIGHDLIETDERDNGEGKHMKRVFQIQKTQKNKK